MRGFQRYRCASRDFVADPPFARCHKIVVSVAHHLSRGVKIREPWSESGLSTGSGLIEKSGRSAQVALERRKIRRPDDRPRPTKGFQRAEFAALGFAGYGKTPLPAENDTEDPSLPVGEHAYRVDRLHDHSGRRVFRYRP